MIKAVFICLATNYAGPPSGTGMNVNFLMLPMVVDTVLQKQFIYTLPFGGRLIIQLQSCYPL